MFNGGRFSQYDCLLDRFGAWGGDSKTALLLLISLQLFMTMTNTLIKFPSYFLCPHCQHFSFFFKLNLGVGYMLSHYVTAVLTSYRFYLSVCGVKESEMFSSCIKRHSFWDWHLLREVGCMFWHHCILFFFSIIPSNHSSKWASH